MDALEPEKGAGQIRDPTSTIVVSRRLIDLNSSLLTLVRRFLPLLVLEGTDTI